jgi:hypothetical protein
MGAPRQRLDQERHDAEQEIHRRLVRHIGDGAQRHEGGAGAGHIVEKNRPAHVAPPQRRPPAIGGKLDDGEQHHRDGDVEIDQQHAEQDHAAGHAEHAGQER